MKNKIQNLEEIWELKSKEFIKIKLREEDVPESTDEFKRQFFSAAAQAVFLLKV